MEQSNLDDLKRTLEERLKTAVGRFYIDNIEDHSKLDAIYTRVLSHIKIQDIALQELAKQYNLQYTPILKEGACE